MAHTYTPPESRPDQPPALKPCPFCGCALTVTWRRSNPKARCTTEGCWGGKLPTLPLDVPEYVEAWNKRAAPQRPALRNFIEAQTQRIRAEAEEKQRRLAAMPAGTCPECEGSGEFVGATHITQCDACKGTGRVV